MEKEFSVSQIADFLRKSYFAVDGLWFVKTEESHGFEEAMRQDEAVWGVMSKIQARKAKALLGLEGNSLRDLAEAFSLKLQSEGYDFSVAVNDSEAVITVRLCPWFEVLKTSGRTHMSEEISERICAREFGGWSEEFSPETGFTLDRRLCVESDGCSECRMRFRVR